jgi:hypothetical protein
VVTDEHARHEFIDYQQIVFSFEGMEIFAGGISPRSAEDFG